MSAQGLHQDVPRQLGHAEAPAYPRTACPRLRRMRQGLRREQQTQAASARSHRGKAFPGNIYFFIYWLRTQIISFENTQY